MGSLCGNVPNGKGVVGLSEVGVRVSYCSLSIKGKLLICC